MLRPFAHPVACCCVLLGVFAQSLKPVKILSQQLPTFRFFSVSRGVAQQCWIQLHSSWLPTLLGPCMRITHALQSLMGCILPMLHCRSQHCWELLHPFERHCQHGRNNSQHYWPNIVGGCYVSLLVASRLLCTQLGNVETSIIVYH